MRRVHFLQVRTLIIYVKFKKTHFLQKLKTLIDHTIYFKERNRSDLKYIIIKKIIRLYFIVLDVHRPGSIFNVKKINLGSNSLNSVYINSVKITICIGSATSEGELTVLKLLFFHKLMKFCFNLTLINNFI